MSPKEERERKQLFPGKFLFTKTSTPLRYPSHPDPLYVARTCSLELEQSIGAPHTNDSPSASVLARPGLIPLSMLPDDTSLSPAVPHRVPRDVTQASRPSAGAGAGAPPRTWRRDGRF